LCRQFLKTVAFPQLCLWLTCRGESGWCSDVTSTHGAWRHAGVRFLLPGDSSEKFAFSVEAVSKCRMFATPALTQPAERESPLICVSHLPLQHGTHILFHTARAPAGGFDRGLLLRKFRLTCRMAQCRAYITHLTILHIDSAH